MLIFLINEIFTNINKLLEFLIDNEIVAQYSLCSSCGEICKLQIYESSNNKTIIYKCKGRGCQKRFSFFNTKLPITNLFHVIYLLLSGVTYKQLFWYYSLSDATISSIKKKMVKCYEK
ncbi:hypothetical protein DMUE_2743 [Dictyocoela muelleri]|nr:hypothetical protein DMUE_2743 [Dictyocoela muelleri]